MSSALDPRDPSRAHSGVNTERSGSVAAFLSFLFPGLGQAYLGQRRAALIFALPVLILLFGLSVYLVSTGLVRTGAKLLDPTITAFGAVLSIVVVLWWAAAIIGAWRGGRRSSAATVLVPMALVAILAAVTIIPEVPLGANWLWSLSVADRGLYNPGNDPTLVADATLPPTASPLPPGQTPTPEPTFAPGETATPEPTRPPDYVDPSDDPSEPPASIIPGPTPSFDITKIDAQDDGWLNVLIIGIDKTVDRQVLTGARSDTMIVVSVNSATGDVYMFSFPRDSAQFPLYNGGTYTGKLNTFAGHTKDDPNFDGGGQPALSYEIGFLLGIPIDYYASVNMDGFQQLVDEVGGVTVCNQHAIDDPDLKWQLSTGLHTLNGADALRYARSRHGMGGGDFARARRQQQLLSALRSELMQPANIARLPDIVTALSGVVNTNFPPDQIDQLVTLANQVQATPTGEYVFQFPEWADHLPAGQTNGRAVQFLDLVKIGALSQQIFGEKSLYWTGKPGPSIQLPNPTPSDSPAPGDTQC